MIGKQDAPVEEVEPIEGGDIDALSQAHMKGKGFGIKVARKLYDWWKPPMSFEEWREREQSRFRSDAEAEHALEQAKADKKIAKAEKQLAKLIEETEAHRHKLHEIREMKMKLADEIGVWVGDEDNYVDWDEVREHMARKEATDRKIEEEDPDWDNAGYGLVVDWEDIKWGSFTKQFEEYKRQHPNSKIDDLEHFANSILANPSDYRKTTIKRARFYLNVLLKKKSQHNNIMPHTQGGRMIGLARPAVLPHHIGHPALVSDQYPRIPQAFTQVHMSHPVPIGHGLYAGGSGLGGRIDPAHILDSAYGGARHMLGVGVLDDIRHTAGKAYGKARTMSGVGIMEDAEKRANKVIGKARKMAGVGMKPHFVKGSAEAKEYMKKIRGMKGGKIPAPHSRSPITDPSLLG